MGLFSKKNNEYDEASLNLNSQQEALASERLIMEQLVDDDEHALELVHKLRDGYPLVLNFERLNRAAANKLLGFFTGAACALDGNTIVINDFTYLFARKEEFMDGSLSEFISQL